MYADLTIYNNLIFTLIGVAGAVIAASCFYVVAVVCKRIPRNLKSFLQYVAAAVVFWSIFKELTLHNVDIYFYKSLVTASISMASLSIIMSAIFVLYGKASLLGATRTCLYRANTFDDS
ncbi:MAG: hypothetical protein RSB59_07535, partial [Clostridia bacterium]